MNKPVTFSSMSVNLFSLWVYLSNVTLVVLLVILSHSTAKDRKHYLNYLEADFDTRLEPLANVLFDTLRLIGYPKVALALLCCFTVILLIYFFREKLSKLVQLKSFDLVALFGIFWLMYAPNALIQIRFVFASALLLFLLEVSREKHLRIVFFAILAPTLHLALTPYAALAVLLQFIKLPFKYYGKYFGLFIVLAILIASERGFLVLLNYLDPYYMHFLELSGGGVNPTIIFYSFLFAFWKFKSSNGRDTSIFIIGYAIALMSIFSYSFYLKLALPFYMYSLAVFYENNLFKHDDLIKSLSLILMYVLGLGGTILKIGLL